MWVSFQCGRFGLLTVLGGGIGYTGSTACVAGYACHSFSEWYSQCNPAAVTSVVSSPTSAPVSSPTSAPVSTPTPTPPPPPPPSCPSGTSLDAKIKAQGREYFGTCTDKNTLSDPAYEAIVIAEYGQVTPENSMKWESTESESLPSNPFKQEGQTNHFNRGPRRLHHERCRFPGRLGAAARKADPRTHSCLAQPAPSV